MAHSNSDGSYFQSRIESRRDESKWKFSHFLSIGMLPGMSCSLHKYFQLCARQTYVFGSSIFIIAHNLFFFFFVCVSHRHTLSSQGSFALTSSLLTLWNLPLLCRWWNQFSYKIAAYKFKRRHIYHFITIFQGVNLDGVQTQTGSLAHSLQLVVCVN